ncbi:MULTISPECIES: TIGR02757 family protein [unclassified Spirosoma]|uniref:TIGR02757 family protein n=1 Tax=unclassified Spirosoma TaxID=2621999 RepID=UPI0009628C93|nr:MULTISPECIES: TIGR02757 family protein [unclassified Spirosoma]MBN8826079.1 TIGR02757 family protein [Spirosoma sp.]OJW75530.1 MAG: TIGR02757 family protein [Spirosoma sp. 48-14]
MKPVDFSSIKNFLDAKADQYNRPSFIERDPISIPHRFSQKQDIEIMGFWAAVLAWGQRPVILKKSAELVDLMDGTPYDFIRNHQESDLKRFLSFKHRTFNATDALYFLHFFRQYYQHHNSLEDAFLPDSAVRSDTTQTVEAGLIAFHDHFCGLTDFFPERTRKHIATPARNSSCKRLLMFLRWMVRRDDRGVDFGLWTRIRPEQLIIPIDVHVNRVARQLALLTRPQTDWKAALELTETLRLFDPSDPVRYDFALFGLGVEGEM